jgi:esterase/lipase superfamily enzyme
MRRLSMVAATLLLAACASNPVPPPPTPAPGSSSGEAPATAAPVADDDIETKGGPVASGNQNYARMRVFYATDRRPASDFATADQADKYTGDRGPMAYGQAFVSIPRGHIAGELEAPSIFRLEFREDPEKHVVLLQTTPQPKEVFLKAMRARVASSKGKNAFIFVHGYNVAFADAARRTAQLAYDLSFDGAPVFFSWPSQASLQGYTVDEANIEWATSHIKQFIVDAAEKSGADNLYLVGHSMGNRGLTRALAAIVLERPDLRGRFREIILAAPDVDAEVFRNDLAPALTKAGKRVTLYASSKDMALKASKEVHGYPRAGDAADGILVMPGIDTIDASNVDDSMLAHSYFVESIPVIRDIANMLRKGQSTTERGALKMIKARNGVHWVLQPVAPK